MLLHAGHMRSRTAKKCKQKHVVNKKRKQTADSVTKFLPHDFESHELERVED